MTTSPNDFIDTGKLTEGEDSHFFGFRLDVLPDFLLDNTLLGEKPAERLQEHIDRWAQFVGNLWTDTVAVSYSLRFHWHPDGSGSSVIPTGSIDVCFLARVANSVSTHNSYSSAQLLRKQAASALGAFGFAPIEINRAKLGELRRQRGYRAWEVTQAEYNASIRPIFPDKDQGVPREFISNDVQGGEQCYALRPLWGAGGPFLFPFRILTAQAEDVIITSVLHATTLLPKERYLLAAMARETESLANLTENRDPMNELVVSQTRSDPQLRSIARVYAANLRRLQQPFLSATYCLAANSIAAEQVARSIANALREDASSEPPVGEDSVYEMGAQAVLIPNDESEGISIGEIIATEMDMRWIEDRRVPTQAPNPALRRLRYLTSAAGAAAFRLPVSVNGGVPGITVRQRAPDFHPGPRVSQTPSGQIHLGDYNSGDVACIPVDALTKHVLITGFTGSGKTTTVYGGPNCQDSFGRYFKECSLSS